MYIYYGVDGALDLLSSALEWVEAELMIGSGRPFCLKACRGGSMIALVALKASIW